MKGADASKGDCPLFGGYGRITQIQKKGDCPLSLLGWIGDEGMDGRFLTIILAPLSGKGEKKAVAVTDAQA